MNKTLILILAVVVIVGGILAYTQFSEPGISSDEEAQQMEADVGSLIQDLSGDLDIITEDLS